MHLGRLSGLTLCPYYEKAGRTELPGYVGVCQLALGNRGKLILSCQLIDAMLLRGVIQVIPLFVTSLLIPFLAVILQVVRSDQKPHTRLDPQDATRYVFAAMWTPVIMLLLGGFTIAAALSKYQIAKLMATFVLSKAGTRPRTVLITNMFVAMVASMWISNVAAPVLCFSIIEVSFFFAWV